MKIKDIYNFIFAKYIYKWFFDFFDIFYKYKKFYQKNSINNFSFDFISSRKSGSVFDINDNPDFNINNNFFNNISTKLIDKSKRISTSSYSKKRVKVNTNIRKENIDKNKDI